MTNGGGPLDPQSGVNEDFDFDFFAHHYDPLHPKSAEQLERAVPLLNERCPVTHSDAQGGYWLVSAYKYVTELARDYRTFSNKPGRMIGALPENFPVMPPFDVDPPEQTEYRHVLNPFFTPARVQAFEPGVRELVTELIDGFIEDGSCDLMSQFAREFPGRMLYKFIFNLDPDEVSTVQRWARQCITQPDHPETPEASLKWGQWTFEFIQRRRQGPRQDDVIDALLRAELEGRPLTDLEVLGALTILILGGFGTTADAVGNAMYRLALDHDLQERLRSHPDEIGDAIDEFLRFDPPVAMLNRLCTRDTTVGGQQFQAGERIALSVMAANRDGNEFPQPERIDLDRPRNRHLSFGLGPHRCLGSNVARQNLRVSLEELLARLSPFRLAEGYEMTRDPMQAWGPNRLLLTFAPGPRLGRRQ